MRADHLNPIKLIEDLNFAFATRHRRQSSANGVRKRQAVETVSVLKDAFTASLRTDNSGRRVPVPSIRDQDDPKKGKPTYHIKLHKKLYFGGKL